MLRCLQINCKIFQRAFLQQKACFNIAFVNLLNFTKKLPTRLLIYNCRTVIFKTLEKSPKMNQKLDFLTCIDL